MNEQQRKKTSKFLSYVLRHQPDEIGIVLENDGWTSVEILLEKMNDHGKSITFEQLVEVVETNDKQRFAFDSTHDRIRASQGHSVQVDLGYEAATPPDLLYHGTPSQFVDPIRESGLKKQQRHHVHLHTDRNLATTVGQRRGKPVLLEVEAGKMAAAGHLFYVTPNQVWLTDHVPSEYINFPE